ncbi:MAG TPA: alpha/beta hydrolase [Thermoanaerobaculia bacterium]|nr:alpha/beta hydrolase [Thermoanaerobaculia bacterium]
MNKPKSPFLTHRVSGRGEPLLLLNGALMSLAAWQPLVPRLERSWKVIRCDFRGQFFSPGEQEPHLDAHIRDVLALLDHLALSRVHIAGVSFGSLAGLRMAARHPNRVASVAAITSSDTIRPEGAWRLLEPVRDALLALDANRVFDVSLPMFGDDYVAREKEMLELQRQWITNLPEIWHRGVGQIMVAVEAIDLREDLPKVRCPVQVISAEQDKIFPPAEGQILAASVKNGRFAMVPGAGHNLVVEKPNEVAEILAGFFSRIPFRPGGFL